MNQPIPEFVSYVPVPCVCDGIIIEKVDASPTYDISIDRTPLGAFQGTVRAHPIYQEPMDEAIYEDGDRVKALVVFMFDVNNNKFDGVAQSFQTQILGKYDPEALIDTNINNPISERDSERVVVKNKKSDAAVVLTDNHEATLTPGGSISHTLKAFGNGIYKNSSYTRAQNYHRIISHNDPFYNSREMFGMFTGEDSDDESTRAAPEDSLINYRRFVQQTRDPVNWVSTCEGAYAPWMGANNENSVVEIGKDVLYSRIVNADKNRITKEYGEPGTDFILMRVDDVIAGEFAAPTPAGVTPGLLGNRFKMGVSETGEVEIFAASQGLPTVNFAGFKLTIDADGNLTVFSKGKIIFTHGDADEAVNSIVMDPSAGIAVNAMSGFTVNGKKLINENFINFLQTFGATGIAVSVLPPGSPEPLHPLFITNMKTQSQSPDVSPFGFLTAGIPIPALGIISQPDQFSTT